MESLNEDSFNSVEHIMRGKHLQSFETELAIVDVFSFVLLLPPAESDCISLTKRPQPCFLATTFVAMLDISAISYSRYVAA